ncbi:DUF4258 domain-containing protein [Segetibacter aerophilus]|uniref:DUF4258 domain-containing protein n=1 Tax=Segetibacter aerophilus TaxID=670293 RepID=UPI0011BDE130|nr:DUF4258 domain-containing protein [Segetibacter aerophilus]
MKLKKILPVLLLAIMAVMAISMRRCNTTSTNSSQTSPSQRRTPPVSNSRKPLEKDVNFDRNTTNLYFTKHAKCRMKCRHITQQEVKDILSKGTVNYNKSDLQDPKGPTYAVEGMTDDRQHVRIIFAPKQQHLTVVTVIDLDEEYKCNCT